jgi:hypothetical protein
MRCFNVIFEMAARVVVDVIPVRRPSLRAGRFQGLGWPKLRQQRPKSRSRGCRVGSSSGRPTPLQFGSRSLMDRPQIPICVDLQLHSSFVSRHAANPVSAAAIHRYQVQPLHFRSRQRQQRVSRVLRVLMVFLPHVSSQAAWPPVRLPSSLLLAVLGFCRVTSPHTPRVDTKNGRRRPTRPAALLKSDIREAAATSKNTSLHVHHFSVRSGYGWTSGSSMCMGGSFRILSPNAPICAAASYVASLPALLTRGGQKCGFCPIS